MRRIPVVLMMVVTGAVGHAVAQEEGFRVVENPFQEEYAYRVNYDLDLGVEVDGVRISRFAVNLRRDRPVDPERDNPATIEFDLHNTNPRKVKLQLVILFEDADGNPLLRVNYSPVKLGSKRFLEARQKYEISGPVVSATRKVYLFCEVQR
jgi:hypothetical protein